MIKIVKDELMNYLKLKKQLEQFLDEDIGNGDVTNCIFDPLETGEIIFLAKEDGIFCGREVIRTGYNILDHGSNVNIYVQDGQRIQKGQTIGAVNGSIANLLQGERVILNIIQRMSGIATQTARAVATLNSTDTKICDTRKTTPGLRMLEKYAVRCGGGHNHRFGLDDGAMIKDNHIAFAGSITKAVEHVRKHTGHMINIEVETETKEQVIEAVESGVDIIMFDNRQPEEIKEWINLVPDKIITEASGGITLDNLASYKHTGVDYISLGFLTHSVASLDISVKVHINT